MEATDFNEEELRQSKVVAARLMNLANIFRYVHAKEDLWPCEIVAIDNELQASKWVGDGPVGGITESAIKKGKYGWVRTKS